MDPGSMDNICPQTTSSATIQPKPLSALFTPVRILSALDPKPYGRRRLRKSRRRILISIGPGTFTRMNRTMAVKMGIIQPGDIVTYEVSFVMPSQQQRELENPRLLSITARLPDGEVGNVFELNIINDTEHWYCKLCQCHVVGLVLLHEIEQGHVDNMQNASKLPLAPPEVEKVAQIQKTLDNYTVGSLIGLEYLTEFRSNLKKEPWYVCLLCDKESDSDAVILHLNSCIHMLRYIQLHFSTCFRALLPFITKQNNCEPIIRKIVEAIENKFGRLKPRVVEVETFAGKRKQLRNLVANGIHLSEKSGITFEELVDEKQLTTKMSNAFNKHIPSPAVENPESLKSFTTTENNALSVWEHVDDIKSHSVFVSDTNKTNRFEEFKKLSLVIENDMARVLKEHEANPQKHPQYNDEWKQFCDRRYKELEVEGKDAAAYDLKSEWNEFWKKRMIEIHNSEIKVKIDTWRKRFNLPKLISFKITKKSEASEVAIIKRKSDVFVNEDDESTNGRKRLRFLPQTDFASPLDPLGFTEKSDEVTRLTEGCSKPVIDESEEYRSQSNNREKDCVMKSETTEYPSQTNSCDHDSSSAVKSKEYNSKSNSCEKDCVTKGKSGEYQSRSNNSAEDSSRTAISNDCRIQSSSREKHGDVKGKIEAHQSTSDNRDKESSRTTISDACHIRSNSCEKHGDIKGKIGAHRSTSNSRDKDSGRTDKSNDCRIQSNNRDEKSGITAKSIDCRIQSNSSEKHGDVKEKIEAHQGRSNSRGKDFGRTAISDDCRISSNGREKHRDIKEKIGSHQSTSSGRDKESGRTAISDACRIRSNSREKHEDIKEKIGAHQSTSNSRDKNSGRTDKSNDCRIQSNSRDEESGITAKSIDCRIQSNSSEKHGDIKEKIEAHRSRSNSRGKDSGRTDLSDDCRIRSNSREKHGDIKGKIGAHQSTSSGRDKDLGRTDKSNVCRIESNSRDEDSGRTAKSNDCRIPSNSRENHGDIKGKIGAHQTTSSGRDKESGRTAISDACLIQSNSREKHGDIKEKIGAHQSTSNSRDKDLGRTDKRNDCLIQSNIREKHCDIKGEIRANRSGSNSRDEESGRKVKRKEYRSRSNSREKDCDITDKSRGYRSRSISRDKDLGIKAKRKEYRNRSNSREKDCCRKRNRRNDRSRSNSRDKDSTKKPKTKEHRSRSKSRDKDLGRRTGKSRGHRSRSNSCEIDLNRKTDSSDREYRQTEPLRVMRDVKIHPVMSRPLNSHVETIVSDGDVNIVGILRLLTALEEKLGSLGPKVIDLFAQALKMEKTKARSSESLIDETNCILFETIQEKFKEQLLVGLVDDNQKNAFQIAIQKITSLLRYSDERKRQLQEEKPKMDAIKVPGIGTVDKAAVAKQIATALVLQGKTGVSEVELEQLTNAVVGMAEASKNTDKPITTSNFLQRLSQQNNLETLTSSLQPVASEPESRITMEGLSDLDLQSLLQNFHDLSAIEQRNLISYLKKLESKEPERVDRLRKFVVLDTKKRQEPVRLGSNCLQAPNSVVLEKVVTAKLDSDEDDYTVEDVFRIAKQNVKDNEECKRKAKLPVFETKDFDLMNPKSLIANIVGQFKSKTGNLNLIETGVSSSTISASLSVKSRVDFSNQRILGHNIEPDSCNYRLNIDPRHNQYGKPHNQHQINRQNFDEYSMHDNAR